MALPRILACFIFCISTNLSAATLADIPLCPDVGEPSVLAWVGNTLESAAFDAEGKLIVGSWLGNRVYGLDAPGSALRVVKEYVWAPGGLALMPDGDMLVGSGIDTRALFAPALGFSKLLKVDLETGEHTVYARGLSMGNGVVRAPDGTVYASNDLKPAIDRIKPDGTVQRGWYRATPGNGLALSNDGSTLFANVSLGNTRVMAIDPETAEATTYFQPPAGLNWVFLDDLDIDRSDRLYAPTYFGGQVWRIETDGRFCALAKNILLPAGITVGEEGAGFSKHSVYVTTHWGQLIEIPNAIPQDGVE